MNNYPIAAAPPRPPAPPQESILEDEIFKVDFGKIFAEPQRSLTPGSMYGGIKLPERGRVMGLCVFRPNNFPGTYNTALLFQPTNPYPLLCLNMF